MMQAGCGGARSFLFTPANRPERVAKALATESDVVIADLEDGVGEQDKVGARRALSALELSQGVYVRINAVGTAHFELDVAMCRDVEWLGGVVLPMVSSVEDVRHLAQRLRRDIEILALIETPRGLLAAEAIATSGVSRLLFGGADYSAALGVAPSNQLFAYPRSVLAVASSAAGLPAPVDGPALAIDDLEVLAEDLKAAKDLGMGGKLCIHPSQVPLVNSAFSHTDQELEWAQSVLQEARDHEGAFALNGQMVDAPILQRAKRIVASRSRTS